MTSGPDGVGAVDPLRAALKGHCPRCGKGKLYRNLLEFTDRCPACGLDIAGFNVGDGPAAFLIFLLGFLVVGLAMWLEFGVHPPWWVHALLWPPILVVLTVWGLRVGKAILLALEFRNEAAEGRLSDKTDH
ncbi:DUF983 domain-containing protein [Sphingosinicella microcystinivorans]|uniref:DUF983 domain-containing protein n=1 Tax=Sphingosinicella microcystinivorans TaxID=335406 RepID=UPI0022F3DF45|nr:DUF983 domain-containing protein [Sphingosinicella microcystinivorans]WBX85232.1 DUF983 domain-containing protein [Sphingosinicella microcystinivorans]